jgi:diguanylate cyclase (GGDEF)-like protein
MNFPESPMPAEQPGNDEFAERVRQIEGLDPSVAAFLIQHEQQQKAVIAELTGDKQQLMFASEHNPVTEMLNRRGIHRQVAEARRDMPGVTFGVVFADLSRFKDINDKYGHAFGNHVLNLVAAQFRSADIYGLLGNPGGDEFEIVAPLIPDPNIQIRNTHLTEAERLGGLVQKTRNIGAILSAQDSRLAELRFGIAAGGVTLAPGMSLEDAEAAADSAMYEDKRSQRRILTPDQLGHLAAAAAHIEAADISDREIAGYLEDLRRS